MKVMRFRIRLVASLFFAVLLGLNGSGCRPRVPRTMTTTAIAQLYQGIESLERKEGQSVKAIAKANGLEATDLNSAIMFLLHKYGIADKPIGFGTDMAGVIDAWGEPLRFIWNDSTDAQSLNVHLRLQKKSVLIWSKGPNKIDEKGGGDDVSYVQTK